MKKIGITLFTFLFSALLCFSASAEETAVNPETNYPQSIVVDNILFERGVDSYWILEGDNEYYHYSAPGNFYEVRDFFYDEELSKNVTELVIPSSIKGLPVTVINPESGWSGADEGYNADTETIYEGITKIKLPTTLKEISNYSFSQFPNVESLTLPENVERIGEGAFGDMTSLKEINIPKNVKELSKYTFMNCISLEKINFEGVIEGIGARCFESCKALKTIDLPETMTYLNGGAFKYSGLTSITVPALTEEFNMHESVFSGCEDLETVVFLSDENTTIWLGQFYFANCTSLKSVTFSGQYESVKLKNSVFRNCDDLRRIYFESLEGTVSISNSNTFKNCYMLEDIYYAASEKRWKSFVKEDSTEEKAFKNLTVHYFYNHTHNFIKEGEDATCTKGATHKYTCDCGLKYTYKVGKDTSNHSYGSWKTVKKPTIEKTGTKQKTCTRCGKVKSKKIDKLIDISTCKIKVKNGVYSSGKPVKVNVTLQEKTAPYKELKKGVHFNVTYENNINVGTEAIAIIKGISKNGYGGTKRVKFSIAPSTPENIKAVNKSITSTSVKLKWDKSPGATDYKINIHDVNDTEYENTIILSTKGTSLTVKNLKPNTTYEITVTSYAAINNKLLYKKIGNIEDSIFVTTKK